MSETLTSQGRRRWGRHNRWHFMWQKPERPFVAWGRWGPASRPDWWMFRWLTVGPLHVRVFRKNPPWKSPPVERATPTRGARRGLRR